jgi:hypothetical protein
MPTKSILAHTTQTILIENKRKFNRLYQYTLKLHSQNHSGAKGHGFDHDLLVAQYGAYIAPEPRVATLAWIAGLLHSTDRVVRPERVIPTLKKSLDLLPAQLVALDEKASIMEAVLKHSRKNEANDSLLTATLKDADRLANTNPTLLIRTGQFYHKKPCIIPAILRGKGLPNTYSNPSSVFESIDFNIEWETWFRLPRAKKLGKQHCQYLKKYLRDAKESYEAIGLPL